MVLYFDYLQYINSNGVIAWGELERKTKCEKLIF